MPQTAPCRHHSLLHNIILFRLLMTIYIFLYVYILAKYPLSRWCYNDNIIIIINTVFVYAIYLAIKPFRGALHYMNIQIT